MNTIYRNLINKCIVRRGRTVPFIYKTTNLINNKIYIGKAKQNDPTYLGSGLKLTAAIKKYTKRNFYKEILEECELAVLNSREKYWINFFNSTDNRIGYNISTGGDGGDHYWSTLTDDQKIEHNRKISESKKGKSTGPRSPETRQKMSANFNRDPNILAKRAKNRCRRFTCVNHNLNEIYVTNDLKTFCITHGLVYANMLYNARTKKTFTERHWSCRKEEMTEDIIQTIVKEIDTATTLISQKISGYDRSGEKNPMYGKKHSDETKNKIRKKRINNETM